MNDKIDHLVKALQKALTDTYNRYDYNDADLPFGSAGLKVWLEFEQGTTKN